MLKELRQAAQELNEVLGLEPPIEIDNTQEELIIAITDASNLIDENDRFSDQTLKVLQMIKEQEQ